MRRASTLAALPRSLITSPVQQQNYTKLIQTTSTNTGSYSRWFSTSVGSKSSTGGKICLSLGGVAVAVGATSLLVKEDAYAKEALRADVAPKEVVLYQYEACPFCNKVKVDTQQRRIRRVVLTPKPATQRNKACYFYGLGQAPNKPITEAVIRGTVI